MRGQPSKSILIWVLPTSGALQKALGRGVLVGNTQIRMDVSRTKSGWQEPLVSALEKLATFRERIASLQAAVVG